MHIKFLLFAGLWTGILLGFLKSHAQGRGGKTGFQGWVADMEHQVKMPGVQITFSHQKSGAAYSILTDSTAFNRTRQTIAPVARQFGLTPVLYAEPDELKAHILQHYDGKTVLVSGHSNTVGPIVQTLAPGTVVDPIADGEYDNLYVVVLLPGHAQVLRLKYGDKSP